MTREHRILGVGALGLAAALGLLLGGPLAWTMGLVLVLTWAVPGALAIEALLGRTAAAPEPLERVALSAGAGYSLMLATELALSYIPGPQTQAMTLGAYGALVAALTVWALRPRLAPPESSPAWPELLTPERRRVALLALTGIILVAAFFRLTNLGYTEYQGDEARAALRAAAVIQGDDNVLFIHKKGPTEILLPAVSYGLTGRLTEWAARLPFALASLMGLVALFVAGWRVAGPAAAVGGALLLALDGYLIGFARIVQYQSIIFLTSLLVFLILLRLTRDPREAPRYLIVAALSLATGLLSHYEAILVVPAAAWLLLGWWWRHRPTPATLFKALAPALLLGGGLLAAFYIPFVRHPNFAATYTYLAERRIGGQFPYNNLEDFFLRTTVYSSSYYVIFFVGLLVLALLRLFWESRSALLAHGQRLARSSSARIEAAGNLLSRSQRLARASSASPLLFSALLVVTVGGTAWNPGWATIGATDLLVIPFALVLLFAFLMPAATMESRALLIWFGLPMLAAFFFTEKPRTHVYTFFTAWALLNATVLAAGWYWLRRRTTRQQAFAVGGVLSGLAVLVFGGYLALAFVQTHPEYIRNWSTARSPLYWTPYAEPDDKALFGFPLRMGWKVVGDLYGRGEFQGPYETNEKEAWVPDWYTRGERRCRNDARYFFLIDNLEAEGRQERAELEAWLAADWHPIGVVTVDGDPRMRIFERGPGGAPDPLPTFEVSAAEQHFDAALSGWDFRLGDPAIEPHIPNPISYRLGDHINLLGFALNDTTVHPGESVELTLFWRATASLPESYTVFNQVLNPNVAIYGQQDSPPVCGSLPTDRWDPGQLITDHHVIPIRPDADVGTFPLIVGMYQAERGERLNVVDGTGNPVGNQIELATITVEPAP